MVTVRSLSAKGGTANNQIITDIMTFFNGYIIGVYMSARIFYYRRTLKS